MPPNMDRDRPPAELHADATPDLAPTPSHKDSTPLTLPSEAESLLRHLNLGAAKTSPLPPTANGEFPRIPNYEIEDEIGRGGMGVVYKARHLSLHRSDAVKMILASAHAAPGEVARFMAEAEAIASVKHPNVVQVYGLGDSGGLPYFVMEFVEGGNLSALLKTGGPLSPTVAAELIAEVASGVQAAHDAGIVHRDLKPANILLGNAECGMRNAESRPRQANPSGSPQSAIVPKVSDFGLAKRLASDLTRSQAVMGTPAYMAPEQAGKAKFVGPGADVYALGAILYECLTGRPPFDSPDAWSLIRQVLEDAPEPLRKRVPGVPRDLELICLKCLEKEPHHRYPTAAALADDLNHFVRGEPVSVRPIGPFTRVARWAKRHPAPAALVSLVALLMFVLPPLAVWQQGRLDRRDAVAEEAEIGRAEAEKARIAAEQLAATREQVALQARRAQDEADRARVAAEQLANVQKLFALQDKMRTRATARQVGWTLATREDLPHAVALAGGDADKLSELRSVAAEALMAPDLSPLEPILRGFAASAAATDPKTGMIALGEFHAWAPLEQCRVRLVDAATGRIERGLKFPAGFARNSKGDLAPDSVRSLAFSADGKRLFVGTRSSSVVRFDLDKPEDTPAKQWKVAASPVECLGVSPDGKTVYAICGAEKPVFVWSTETGELVTKLEPEEGRFNTFTLLPSGDVIAGQDGRVYHWDAAHKLVGTHARTIGLRMAPTGTSMLLVANGGYLEVYDRHAFDLIERYFDRTLRTAAHDESVKNIVLHPSGAYIATCAGDRDRAVKVWELSSGRLIGTVTSPGTTPIRLAWSGDGRYLLATSSRFVSRWRFAPAEAQRFACVSGNTIASATFLPGGRVAALGEVRNGKRELNVELPENRMYMNWLSDRGGNGREGLASAPDGTLLATLDTPGIFHWRPEKSAPPMGFTKQPARCARMSPDGKTLWAVVSSQEVHSFDPATQKLLEKWSNSAEEVLSGLSSLDALAVSRNAVVAGCVNGSVYVLDPSTCKPRGFFPQSGDPVLAVAVAPDDSLIVAGTQQGMLRMMNPATKAELPPVTAHTDGTTAVAINRDGTLLVTGGRDRAVRLWKRASDCFEPLLTVSDLPGTVRELHFCPSDNRLIVLIAHGHAVRVWDLDKLQAQLTELKLGW